MQTDDMQALRQELAQARDEAVRLRSLVSEMRQPLAVMAGYSQLIAETMDAKTRELHRLSFDRIESNAQRAVDLINTGLGCSGPFDRGVGWRDRG